MDTARQTCSKPAKIILKFSNTNENFLQFSGEAQAVKYVLLYNGQTWKISGSRKIHLKQANIQVITAAEDNVLW
ncbi:hypothetical protein AV530_009397 [Patagioenas fasciata monilis]|uniref:Uncharacterized protein n=1 Tax=Patagioenas fasciata monilis TaxID=372326 RepID=A0A1V4JIV5_PATFA|nr:hypothetical protein AV530_009397 [Patagioenas fasciata monilis]